MTHSLPMIHLTTYHRLTGLHGLITKGRQTSALTGNQNKIQPFQFARMKTGFVILIVGFSVLAHGAWGQKVRWGIRTSFLLSSQYHKGLVYAEGTRDIGGVRVVVSSLSGDGRYNFRPGLSLGTFAEIFPFKDNSRFSLVASLGYRQKGFLTPAARGTGSSSIQKTNNRLDVVYLDIAERFYYRSWYFFVGARYDWLFNHNVEFNPFIFDYYKKHEISPFVGLGRILKIGKTCLQIEAELNPGLQNMLYRKNYTINYYDRMRIRTFVVGVNLAYYFGHRAAASTHSPIVP
jgi:hypothetical protein